MKKFFPILLLVTGLVVYHNSFHGPFIFDDTYAIQDNPHIRHLWPIWDTITPPPQATTTQRPVVAYSIALNFALGGLEVWGYHAFNLGCHLISALLVYGILRRTLQREYWGGRYRGEEAGLAMAVAMVWMVHPLLTEAVNYIIQRTELMMGMFYLLTMYCAIRSFETERPVRWQILAVMSCGAGMGSKQVMVSCPILVWLYDYLFVGPTVGEMMQKRWRFYLGLGGTWILLWILMATGPVATVGFHFEKITPWTYFKTEWGVIVHYLRLSFWPHPLIIDYYQWKLARDIVTVLPAGIFLVSLFCATVGALVKKSPGGLIGAWFFLILAPTSSVLPIVTEVAAERRMYLPVLAIVIWVIVGGHTLAKTIGLRSWMWVKPLRNLEVGMVGILVLALGWATHNRNSVYSNQEILWRDAIEKNKTNPRAQMALGLVLVQKTRIEEAIDFFREALRLDPEFLDAKNSLGTAMGRLGHYEEATVCFQEILSRVPDNVNAHINLASAYAHQKKYIDAIAEYQKILRLDPDNPNIHYNWAQTLIQIGQMELAVTHYAAVARLSPLDAEARSEWADLLAGLGKWDEAIQVNEDALKIAITEKKVLLEQTLRVRQDYYKMQKKGVTRPGTMPPQ